MALELGEGSICKHARNEYKQNRLTLNFGSFVGFTTLYIYIELVQSRSI